MTQSKIEQLLHNIIKENNFAVITTIGILTSNDLDQWMEASEASEFARHPLFLPPSVLSSSREEISVRDCFTDDLQISPLSLNIL